MNVCILLDDTSVSARARTVLAYADALCERNVSVRITTTDTPVSWRPSAAQWFYLDDLRAYDGSREDALVATSTATARIAQGMGAPRVLHLCFGDESPETYALPLPKLAPSPAVEALVRRFSDDVTVTGTIVDDEVFRERSSREHEPLRILISGASHDGASGVDDAYGAVAHARWFHQKFDLVRVSPWAPSRQEPLDAVQEFHVGLTTGEMARLLHSCDVVVAAALHTKVFGLLVPEALAAGVPVVTTGTPGHRCWSEEAFAMFAPERLPVELGERLIELLSDEELRGTLRRSGWKVAQQWRAERVGEQLETVLRL